MRKCCDVSFCVSYAPAKLPIIRLVLSVVCVCVCGVEMEWGSEGGYVVFGTSTVLLTV